MTEWLLKQYEQRYNEIRKEIVEIDIELRRLTNKRSKLRVERSRLLKQLSEPATGTKPGNDSLVVPRTQLANEIESWLNGYHEEHGTTKGARKLLAIKSKVTVREIRRIVNGPGPSSNNPGNFITLRVADRILTAMGRQDAIAVGGRIRVVPNPR